MYPLDVIPGISLVLYVIPGVSLMLDVIQCVYLLLYGIPSESLELDDTIVSVVAIACVWIKQMGSPVGGLGPPNMVWH